MPVVFFPEKKYPVTKSTDPEEVKKRYMEKYVRRRTAPGPVPSPPSQVEPSPDVETIPEEDTRDFP